MDDPTESNAQAAEPAGGPPAGWLLLMHQLPAEPAYLRVKVLRRLRGLGAVALRNSVYVLPNDDGAREDFLWLRREIVGAGGEAILSIARFVEGIMEADLEHLFITARNEEYADLVEAIGVAAASAQPAAVDMERLRRRLDAIRARDHFGAAGRFTASQALRELERRVLGRGPEEGRVVTKGPDGATWVTRTGVRVDRMASAWLIQRFIDPSARLKFVQPDGYEPAEGELRFDMFEGEFTHEADLCTFETLVRRFALDEPALRPIAEIVHDIDCKDEKHGRPETAGIASVLGGIAAAHGRDEDRISAAVPLFDALLESFRRDRPGP